MPGFLKSIDWNLLHKQKLLLDEAVWCSVLSEDLRDAMEGIVFLLDALQDEAEGRHLWSPPSDDTSESKQPGHSEK